MKQASHWAMRIYALLLTLYPPDFRTEFGEEMLAVFAEAFANARPRGRLSSLTWYRQEFGSVLSLLIREQWLRLRGEKSIMNQELDENPLNDFDDIANGANASWSQILAAALPLILAGSIYVLKGMDYHDSPPPGPNWPINRYWQFFVLAVLLIGLGFAWLRNFPRWSYTYLGIALMISSGLATNRMVALEPFGYASSLERYGWRGWLPLMLAALVMLLLTRTLRPLAQLVAGLRRDWTLFSFVLYAMLCYLVLGVTYDGKTWYLQTQYLPLNLLLIAIVFAVGVFPYMRVQRPWPRALMLTAALYLHRLLSSAVIPASANPDTHLLPGRWLTLELVWLFWSSVPLLPGLVHLAWLRLRPRKRLAVRR